MEMAFQRGYESPCSLSDRVRIGSTSHICHSNKFNWKQEHKRYEFYAGRTSGDIPFAIIGCGSRTCNAHSLSTMNGVRWCRRIDSARSMPLYWNEQLLRFRFYSFCDSGQVAERMPTAVHHERTCALRCLCPVFELVENVCDSPISVAR